MDLKNYLKKLTDVKLDKFNSKYNSFKPFDYYIGSRDFLKKYFEEIIDELYYKDEYIEDPEEIISIIERFKDIDKDLYYGDDNFIFLEEGEEHEFSGNREIVTYEEFMEEFKKGHSFELGTINAEPLGMGKTINGDDYVLIYNYFA